MSFSRLTFLVLGPITLVGVFYSLTMGRGVGDVARETASVVTGAVLGDTVVAEQSTGRPGLRGMAAIRPSTHVRDVDLVEQTESGPIETASAALERHCQEEAARLKSRVGKRPVLIRPPFVVSGDLNEDELKDAYEKLVLPVSRALCTCYFDRPPDAPVQILLYSDDASFQEAARQFDGKRRSDYYGYYRREDRRIMLNASSGTGTLAHELTHALAHFDFPEMPEWFDEGLASLHEESEFSEDGRQITGQQNWRVNHLLLALRRGKLRTLQELLTGPAVRPGLDAVDYAHARYFCLYLQKRHLLEPYYRKLRQAAPQDHSGIITLESLIEPDSVETLDRDFRQWVAKLRPISRRAPLGIERL